MSSNKEIYNEIALEMISEYIRVEKEDKRRFDLNGGYDYHLPIESIDDIDVDVSIQLKKYMVTMSIEPKHTNDPFHHNDIFSKKITMNTKCISDALEEALEMINKLRFDKSKSQFVTTKEDKMKNKFVSLLSKMEKVKCIDTCSVCYDLTNAYTVCNHPLCLGCFQKMMPKYQCDDDEYKTDCPICRATVEQYDLCMK